MNDTMKIEKMTKQDITQVAEQLCKAFADKFTEKTLLSERQVKQLIKMLWLEETSVFGVQSYVLKEDDEVVGTFGITIRKRKKLTVSFVAKVLAAIHVLGIKRLLRFAEIGLETNRKPDKNELYIDFLAVKESKRNQHLGHRLLKEIDQLIERNPAIEKISLYVLKDNDRALHLYKKQGFKVVTEHESDQYYYMVKKFKHS